MITLWESEYATQTEIARSFGYSARSLRRYQERLHAGGISALVRGPGRPPGGSQNAKKRGRDQTILNLKVKGSSNRSIAGKLGLSEKAIRKRLRRMEWQREVSQPGLLFQEQTNADAFPKPDASKPPKGNPAFARATASAPQPGRSEDIETTPVSLDRNPFDRILDRLFAALGLIEDAAPMFAYADSLPRAGVLLAVPPLVASGVFIGGSQDLRHNRPGFLRTTHHGGYLHSPGIAQNPTP